ncbi:sensor histidine kinase [Streptococcus sp. H49]|uniref:sensor histidine kinase n=1 Tax=Streptococcus huangxiaojuni TaxID=3237239 RepID=UPI0034A47EB3
MAGSIYSGLIILVDWLIKLFVFSKISGLKIGLKKILIILTGILVLTWFSQGLGPFIESFYLVFILIFILRPRWKPSQYLFYGLVPIVLVDLFQRITGIFMVKHLFVFNVNTSSDDFIFSLFSLLVFLPVYFLFIRIMQVDFENIDIIFNGKMYQVTVYVINTFLLVYCVVINPLMVWNNQSQFSLEVPNYKFSIDVTRFYLLFFIAAIIYVNFRVKDQLDKELRRSKERQLKSLSEYSKHVESLYREIRSFRHDYTNILVSLSQSINNEDLPMIKQIYKSILEDSDKKFYDAKYDMANLANIKDEALKSILFAKLSQAQHAGIDVTIEIIEPIGVPNMELLDVITILSILLDNAIEASLKAEEPSFLFAYFKEANQTILIVDNATQFDKTDTKSIFNYGESSKGEERGIGLANVREILGKYPDASLMTTSSNYRFRQELHILEKKAYMPSLDKDS